MDLNILLLILVPLITAFLVPLFDLINIKIRKILVIFSAGFEFFISLTVILENYEKITEGNLYLKYYLGGWSPPFGINLVMDNLALIFSTLISFSVLLIIIYSIGFIGHHEGKYYVLIFLILGAMQGTILTGDMFNLYVFIELITLTSGPLIAFKRNQDSTEASIKYMFFKIIAGLLFFLGVILLYLNIGSLNMAEISVYFTELNRNMKIVILSFFLVSILIKSGIFPFFYWMPKAYSACPSPISALLSGVLAKVYIYVFLRLFWNVFDFSILTELGLSYFILYLAIISGLLGHILGLQADDIKRMLSFSSVGHIGMIVGVLFLNTTAGLYAGLLHVISHLLMKSSLFVGTGYLLQFTPSHKINDFGGVAYKNNAIFIGFIITALGMIGVPPLIGFVSKWYILLAFIEAEVYLGLILVIGGSLTAVVYYFRYISEGYKKMKVDKPDKERHLLEVFYREQTVTSIIYIFVSLVFISGILFKVLDLPLKAAVQSILDQSSYIQFILGG
ncbi:MAG: complex I subunit 5 family protein [Halanaerobiaceae bacterium]